MFLCLRPLLSAFTATYVLQQRGSLVQRKEMALNTSEQWLILGIPLTQTWLQQNPFLLSCILKMELIISPIPRLGARRGVTTERIIVLGTQ